MGTLYVEAVVPEVLPERRQRMSGVLKHALHRCKDVDTRQLLSNVHEGHEDQEDQFVPSVN